MATPNYAYEKRQKELAKKRKQEEKRQKKLERKDEPGTGTSPSTDDSAPPADPAQGGDGS